MYTRVSENGSTNERFWQGTALGTKSRKVATVRRQTRRNCQKFAETLVDIMLANSLAWDAIPHYDTININGTTLTCSGTVQQATGKKDGIVTATQGHENSFSVVYRNSQISQNSSTERTWKTAIGDLKYCKWYSLWKDNGEPAGILQNYGEMSEQLVGLTL
jgi:hypothetical protein